VAGLLSIKLHEEINPDKTVEPYPWYVRLAYIHCFGYGCPPVFTPAPQYNAYVEAAMSHSTWFINCHDVVPFLSLDSIKLLAVVLSKVNAITKSGRGPTFSSGHRSMETT
jgi:hypothetical protein